MGKRLRPERTDELKKKESVEQGAVRKTGKGLIKAALVYPNTYAAGMSSLGFQTVYRLINEEKTVSCERVFLSDKGRGPARSVESGLSLNRFDVIFFSISFENDYIHLVQLLGEAGIPLRSPDRNHLHPLVVAGGVACFLNPEPIAPFIDAFLLGEAECLIRRFFETFEKIDGRHALLLGLEQHVPGANVPSRHDRDTPFRIRVQYLPHLDSVTTCTAVLTSGTAFKDSFLIEILKGCPHGCRFCSAGFIYRPPRIYPETNILSAMERARGKTDKIGLVSSAVADHPDLSAICQFGREMNFKLSFSSLRADKLTDELVGFLSQSGVKTATIAPEAGSQRMRSVINKKLSEEDILLAVRKLVSAGIINIRLYFMIGLPFEQDEDIEAIIDLTLKIKSEFLMISRQKKKIGTLTLGVNPFIPKPFTPFQWAPMATDSVLKKRARMLQEGLKTIPNVKVSIESLKQAGIHGLLSLGDRRAADIIETAYEKGWSLALKQNEAYCRSVLYSEKPLDSTLPWDFMENGIKKRFLAQEYQKAQAESISPPCPMAGCDRCGLCR